MDELLQRIVDACAEYCSEELDDAGFQQVINAIPTEVWQDEESALAIVQTLVENEDLYEVSDQQGVPYVTFICGILPQCFRENADYILAAAKIIMDFMAEYCEETSSSDLDEVFSCMPHTPWEDNRFTCAAANLLFARAYAMYDLNCISEVIPESVWKNENELVWVVRSIYNADERNMTQLSLFPRKSWESATVIFEILSCLQDAIENDRSWGTVYGNFRGSTKDYLENFLDYVPDRFKSDKDFILGLLEYDYFMDGFDLVYDWLDQSLWSDKEFVLTLLKLDESTLTKVPDHLAADEGIRGYIEENIDVAYAISNVPKETLPQWLQDWPT